ncbi:MAG: tetratricopeptide repeat protein [Phycisphaerae bacterium]
MTGRGGMLTRCRDWAGLLCFLLAAMLLVLAATLPHRSYGAGLFGVDEAGKGSDDRPATTAETEARLRKQAKQQQRRVVLGRAIAHSGDLIASGKYREAYPLLVKLRKTIGEPRDVRVEALLARVALAENRPDKALEFVGAYAEKRDAYDANLADGYLAAADAHLAAGNSYKALEIFDWVAGSAQGVPLILAAEGCGKALVARKEYQTAVEAIEFALGYAWSRYYDRADLIRRLEALLGEARRLADINLYGEDFVLYRDAERLRREQGRFAEAREVYLGIIEKFPEGHYAEAARLYAAKCLIGLGKIEEAEKELAAFRKSDPYGLYRGEAALELGRIALEHRLNLNVAQGCFFLLDAWIREARSKKPLNIEKLALREAARQVTAPPQEEKYVDWWGNVKKNEIRPGQLVNRKTCPWYLDDLKEQMAMYMGFLCFVGGKKEEALEWYKKILECDPATRRLDTAGEWNDYSRLKRGVELGYLVAYPPELAAFKDPRHRLAVLLMDFYYLTQRFDKSAALAQRLLKGDFGLLQGAAREYAQLAYAKNVYWRGAPGNAFAEFLKVVEMGHGKFQTFAQCHAAFAAGNMSRRVRDPKIREAGHDLLGRLAASGARNKWVYEARIRYAQNLINMGRKEEGLYLLKNFPKDAGSYRQQADYWFNWYLTGAGAQIKGDQE